MKKINAVSSKKGASMPLVVILVGILSILVLGFISSSSSAVSSVANRRKHMQVVYDAKTVNQGIVSLMETDVDNAVYKELDKIYKSDSYRSNNPAQPAKVCTYTTDKTKLTSDGEAWSEIQYVEMIHSNKKFMDVTLDIRTTAKRGANTTTYSTQFTGKRALPGNKKNFPTIRRAADYALLSNGNSVFRLKDVKIFGNAYDHDTAGLYGNIEVISHYDADGNPVYGDFICLGYGGNDFILNNGAEIHANILNATDTNGFQFAGGKLYGNFCAGYAETSGGSTIYRAGSASVWNSGESFHDGYGFAGSGTIQKEINGIWKIRGYTGFDWGVRFSGSLYTYNTNFSASQGNSGTTPVTNFNAEADDEWKEAMTEGGKMRLIHGNNENYAWNRGEERLKDFFWFRRLYGTHFERESWEEGSGNYWSVKMKDDVKAQNVSYIGGQIKFRKVNSSDMDLWYNVDNDMTVQNITVSGSGANTARVFIYVPSGKKLTIGKNATINLDSLTKSFSQIADNTSEAGRNYQTRLYIINELGGNVVLEDGVNFVGTIWSPSNPVKIGKGVRVCGRVFTFGTDGTIENAEFNVRQEMKRSGDDFPVYPLINEEDTPIINVTSGENPYQHVGRFIDSAPATMKTYDNEKIFYGGV